MKCRHWKQIPKEFGSQPKCAFRKDGKFTANNWNCKKMNAIRDIVHEREIWSEDQHLAVYPIFSLGRFAILSYYKHRGQTERFWITDGYTFKEASEKIADLIIKQEEDEKDAILQRVRTPRYRPR
jgi:hypothetical protein